MDEMIQTLEEAGYVVLTGDQWDFLVDALGPASDDIIEMLYEEST